jgi:alkylation response protein AidB-like acyl-CoA dehydrogenase
MGHGSDVRNLQTRATFDLKNQCFIINTPTVKDAKFWPGELGKAATHAVFQAQTYVKGKNVGVQSFVCQIRDMDSQAPLRGVEIGDIGPKYGFAAKDNGYMIFNNFKIPKSSLLSRYVEITDDGTFIQKGNIKVGYSAMMLIRIQLIDSISALLIKPLLIAMRYGYFRTQFKSLPNSQDERRIFDYQATQEKLVVCLSVAWVSRFISRKCTKMYEEMLDQIKNKNKFTKMKDLHSLLCALKAYYMEEILQQVYTMRELTGGHGYLSVNEITEILEMISPNVTLEGDACVMYQQTAKDIFKSVGKLMTGQKVKGTYEYLQDIGDYMGAKLEDKDIHDLDTLIDILKASTIYQVIKVGNDLRVKDDIPFDTKWNKIHLSEIIKTSMLHAIYLTAAECLKGVESFGISSGLKNNILHLCKIYCTDNIIKHGDMALLNGYITAAQMIEVHVSFYLQNYIGLPP